ncbi:hypothetical protein WSM22_03310 [Cytophagales bacterium WSM2-2]|nr:hypothetical protein WSM22_03310 [Cytophagales bacterium WSM2-2]
MNTVIKSNKKYIVISKSFPDFLSDDRLLDEDYSTIDYAQIYGSAYDYSLPDNGTGLLVHNGGLVYPSGNLNMRNYYMKIVSPCPATLAHLTFVIDHTGNVTDWMTDSDTGGTPNMNNIKFEFMIKTGLGDTLGWYNPFADYNQYGVAKTSLSRSGMLTTVSCTLSIVPRINFNDLIIVRIIASPEWTNKIRNIKLISCK